MRLLCFSLLALCPLAVGQSGDSTKPAAKQPRFELPKPFNSAAVQKALAVQQPPVFVLSGTLPLEDKVCAIRLLEYPVDSSIDPKMAYPSAGKARPAKGNGTADKMGIKLPMTACPAQP